MNINIWLFSLYPGTSSCRAGTRLTSPAACNLPGLWFWLESKKLSHIKLWSIQRPWYGPTALLSTRVHRSFDPLCCKDPVSIQQMQGRKVEPGAGNRLSQVAPESEEALLEDMTKSKSSQRSSPGPTQLSPAPSPLTLLVPPPSQCDTENRHFR